MLRRILRSLTTNVARYDDDAADPRLHRPRVVTDIDHLIDRIRAWIGKQSRWDIESINRDVEPPTMHIIRRTRLLGFVDDVRLTMHDVDGVLVVDGVSQSRVGKGDLGQNARNLIELRRAFAE